MSRIALLLAAAALAACKPTDPVDQPPGGNAMDSAAVELSLSRLDCGKFLMRNVDRFLSDRPGLYPTGPRNTVDSCYLIRHGDQLLLWDTGFAPALKGKSVDTGELVLTLDRTIAEQLAEGNLTPADIDIVGISHHHDDHLGQAALFPQARLVMGADDFAKASAVPANAKASPIAPWVASGANVTRATGDVDIFGDGSVIARHLPGHTADHLALQVNLASGPVLLTGDLYHLTEARTKRGVPPFNVDRAATLASMDKFEALARDLKAKVVIQHEAADVKLVPAFPATAK